MSLLVCDAKTFKIVVLCTKGYSDSFLGNSIGTLLSGGNTVVPVWGKVETRKKVCLISNTYKIKNLEIPEFGLKDEKKNISSMARSKNKLFVFMFKDLGSHN